MIKTDGIIFDMDGTIWDNTPLFAKSWTKAARLHGYDVVFTDKMLQGLFGRTMTEIADLSIPDSVAKNRYATLKDCERIEMQDLVESDTTTTYPGLTKTLESLSKRCNLYIVSNCQSGYIETYFELSGHSMYFKDHLCYGDNGLGKADNIRLLVERNNIKNPIYVGDIQKDKDACFKANIPFIWASYGYGDEVDSYLAEIKSIKELDLIIE